MTTDGSDVRHDERLALFRSEWPRRVSWREVHEAEPRVFASAAKGVLLLIPAILATLAWGCLALEFPTALTLPDWIDWSRPFLTIASALAAVTFWIWAAALMSMPAETRRELAVQRFAQNRGLTYARFGALPERIGIFFGEAGGAPVLPARLRDRPDPARKPLYNSRFSLSEGRGSVALDPPLQIAIAGYTGGKNDPKGPRPIFRYLSMRLPRALPHLMIDSRRNGSLRAFLPGSQRLSLEGDFDRHFSAYVPNGYERDALELLTPDVMACLIDHGRRWDIEVIEDRLIVASSRFRPVSDRREATALLRFSELVGAELGHQASTYTDPRSPRPRSQISAAGRRLRRRSGAWTTAIFAGVVALMLAFPHVLGWFLDR